MEKRTTVLVADGSEDFCAQLSGALQNGVLVCQLHQPAGI